MPHFTQQNLAFGHPGMEPRWTQGNKDGVGTAYSTSSRVWFTLWNGTLTEVFYPTIDRPQLRDLQLLISDGQTFFHEEKRHLRSTTARIAPHALGYSISNRDPDERYSIEKEVIADPHLPCVLQRVQLKGDESTLASLQLYVLAAPHLEVSGWGNNARVVEVAGRKLLVAERAGTWLAVGASVPFAKCSAGFVGHSDGWNDLAQDFIMNWEFGNALDGNVALTGQLQLSTPADAFVVGLAFGDNLHQAATTLFQSLDIPFEEQRERFVRQWQRTCGRSLALDEFSCDEGKLFDSSLSLILAHEDKTYPGAFIASLSVPWGEAKSAVEVDGYHLVWPRDMVNSATGLLALGDSDTPLRALIYLAASQQNDGGFPQNFWINATPHWPGVQLDEVSFPILLAHYLKREGALRSFDPFPMVSRAARYLIERGPATQQERWEENAGYSPSTLAANIAALICAAQFFRERDDEAGARFIEEHADWLEANLEAWTVTTRGDLVPGIERHFIRIAPADLNDPHHVPDPDESTLRVANRAPEEQHEFPARAIVDAGFLHLVRYGIRAADDPLIVDSLRVIDATLRVETPFGPCWKRYSHDGYGQRPNGDAFQQWGQGRAWPLLTGERAHYELAAGRDVKPLIAALEKFASETGLLPEQIWDEADIPPKHLRLGGPTGAAMPLVWAHAEYIKLLRSVRDGRVFVFIEDVGARYLNGQKPQQRLQIWKANRQPQSVQTQSTLRLIASRPFRLRWSHDEWRSVRDDASVTLQWGLHFFDIEIQTGQRQPLCWTFFWSDDNAWEGRNYQIEIAPMG
ncbi:MAG: glucoamylase [Abditibacteriota bacterium]|nr:glucoamylase [Abditibacteriota bacterium]